MPFRPTEGVPFSGVVARLRDANPDGLLSELRATIDWGDGKKTTAVLTRTGRGTFEVRGTHTYVRAGTYAVVVQVLSNGGSTAKVTFGVSVGKRRGEVARPRTTGLAKAEPVGYSIPACRTRFAPLPSPDTVPRNEEPAMLPRSPPRRSVRGALEDRTLLAATLVQDVNRTTAAAITPLMPGTHFAAVGNTLFVAADDGVNGTELWRSDGTAAGTRLVKDVNAGPNPSGPSGLVAVGNTIFFTADDGVHGREVWSSDGTAAGTRMLEDITPGPATGMLPFDIGPDNLTVAGGKLFFTVGEGAGFSVWKSAAPPPAPCRCTPSPAGPWGRAVSV